MLSREFLLERGYCCGHGCLMCPYIPKHIEGNTVMRKNILIVSALEVETQGQLEDWKPHNLLITGVGKVNATYELTKSVMTNIESFVCEIYSHKKESNINDVRTCMFNKKAKPKSIKKPLDSIKNIDPTRFPPCQRVLITEQIKRAWFIAHLYKTATEPYPAEEYTAIDFGWKLSECKGYLDINWFTGDQVPEELEEDEGKNIIIIK